MRRPQDWLKQAQAEYAAAQSLYEDGHWAWCCFTCQQAAEKALKAVLEHFGDVQTGHNLNHLLQAVEEYALSTEAVRAACRRLNRLYIPTRYPDAFSEGAPAEQYVQMDAQEALNDADTVLRYAREAIESSPV
ncbi:MAG: HEPN domain-containing protein [Armatimonadota bacterium]|nr:HEPN domain-containing protein [Armatimonadota bacterium]